MIAGLGFHILSFAVLTILLVCTCLDYKTNITVSKIMITIISMCILRNIIVFVALIYGNGETTSTSVISIFDNSIVLIGIVISVLVAAHMVKSSKNPRAVSSYIKGTVITLFVIEIMINIANIIILVVADKKFKILLALPTYIGITIIVLIYYELLRNRRNFPKRIFSLFVTSISIILVVYLYGRLFVIFAPEVYERFESEIDPFSIGYILIACLHFMATYLLRSDELVTKSEELSNALISVAQSQIQPHFINNTLYNIKALYKTDTVKAERMIDNFAGFLKGHKEALALNGAHPFEKELEHIRCYIDIEMERFDNIEAIYDIKVKRFKVPPLMLQPLVENSIKYGLRPKRNGGTIGIATRDRGDHILVVVKDDGVGFDVNKEVDNSRIHVGIENTRFRVENLCGGTLTVQSEVDKGTEILITIPKKVGNLL